MTATIGRAGPPQASHGPGTPQAAPRPRSGTRGLGTGERAVAAATATAALVLLTVVTAISFSRVFDGWGFLLPVLWPALAVHAVAAAMRRVPGVIAIPVTAAVLTLAASWTFYGDTLRFGLPTRLTVDTARAELQSAWDLVGTVVPPVANDAGFGVAAALALGVAALLADAFAFRGRGSVEAVVPAGVVFVAIAAVGIDRNRIASAALWLAAAILVAVVLRAMHEASSDGWIGGRAGGAWLRWAAGGTALAVIVGGAAAAIGPRLPGVGADALLEHHNKRGRDTSVVLNPLVDIRDRLLDVSNAEVFSVASDQPAYWRLTGLPQFDGEQWSLPERKLREAGPELAEAQPYTVAVSQQFVIGRLRGAFAPVAYAPTSLQAASDDMYFITDTATMVLTDPGLADGTSYDVESALPEPPPEALDAATASDPPDAGYLDLPDGFADKYRPLAEAAVGGLGSAVTPYQQARALQDWFRDNFTYSLDVPDVGDDDALDAFLERRTGFCVHFATAYAAFARTLGLPARVAVGFTSGSVGADGRYVVRERNAHAWPEVWFDGIGWVLFEPTPGRGAPGAEGYTGVPPAQDESGPGTPDTAPSSDTTVAQAPPATDPRTPVSTAPSPGATSPAGTGTARASGGHPVPVAVWIVLAVLALLAAWCLLMPRLVAGRLVHHEPEREVAQRWRALVNTASAAGVRGLGSLTALEQARAVADATDLDRGDTLELARAATIAVYSPHGLGDLRLARSREIGDHLIAALRRLLPWQRRLRARLDPRVARTLAGG